MARQARISTRLLAPAAIITLVLAGPSVAETNNAMAEQRDAMLKLSSMDGVWRGTATTNGPSGVIKVIQTERIGPLLDGTIKLVEGKGFNADGSIGFNAFAIISYNPTTKAYTFQSYADGRAGSFKFEPTKDGYVWEIPAGPAIIRYTATIAKGQLIEIGERIIPGKEPMRFFEMKLQRLGASKWPSAGGLKPKGRITD